MNIQLPQTPRIRLERHENRLRFDKNDTHLESEDIIREHNDFVSSVFVILDKELTRLELVGVHAIQQHAFAGLLFEIFMIEFGGHWAPYFSTLREAE